MRVPSSRSETPAFATMLRKAPLLRLIQCIQPRTASLAWPGDLFGNYASIAELMAEATELSGPGECRDDVCPRGCRRVRNNVSSTIRNPYGHSFNVVWSSACKSKWNRATTLRNPTDSMAIVSIPQRGNQSTNRGGSSVKVRNVRTGCSSQSGNFLIGITRKRHHLRVRNRHGPDFLTGTDPSKSIRQLRSAHNRAVCFYRT